jgi:hypothetical protein
MSLAARARMRPVLYPAALLLAFILFLLVESGMSPYVAGRPLIVALVVGLALPWLAGLVTGDRHLAGFIGGVLVLLLNAAQSVLIVVLGLIAVALVFLSRLIAHRQPGAQEAGDRWWPLITRVLTAGALILLMAVGIKAVQTGRAGGLAHDLIAESPVRLGQSAFAAGADTSLPNMYLIMLDGYPRADKLASEFGIHVSEFTRALSERGFFVATHSRSNYTVTHLTLAQMFNYSQPLHAVAGSDSEQVAYWRRLINEGRFFADIRDLGYEVVSVSPGLEHVTLREADRFIDTGQLNQFERRIGQLTAVQLLLRPLLPGWEADLHRSRMLDAFRVTTDLARQSDPSLRFVFAHVMSPHAPQVFELDGAPIAERGLILDDRLELNELGPVEYIRRLDGQLRFLNTTTVEVVDRIIASDPDAVIVVFSDHGSGIRVFPDDHRGSDADLRTANLLAVRSPGRTGIIDDRSTLANLLPRLLRAYAGVGPPDVPETIYAWADDPTASYIFVRPD